MRDSIIDIVGSTQLKDGPVHLWIWRILNTFQNARAYLPISPLKSAGDQLMYYIPEQEIEQLGGPLGLLPGFMTYYQDQFDFMWNLSGPAPTMLKGFASSVDVYRLG